MHAEGVHAAPAGTWLIGALEAAESVIHNASCVDAAVGMQSYLATAPSSTCRPTNAFSSSFRQRYFQLPSGGFAISSYDLVGLSAAALRASGDVVRDSHQLLRTLRNPSFGVQGMGGPLLFLPGENQPCAPPVTILQLPPGYSD